MKKFIKVSIRIAPFLLCDYRQGLHLLKIDRATVRIEIHLCYKVWMHHLSERASWENEMQLHILNYFDAYPPDDRRLGPGAIAAPKRVCPGLSIMTLIPDCRGTCWSRM